MAVDLWTLEGGVPGQAITVANSDDGTSGTPITGISPATGATITYSDESGGGNVGAAFTRTSASTAAFYVLREMAGTASRAVSVKVMFPTLPSQVVNFIGHRSTGNVQAGFITLNAANKFEIRNSLNVAHSTAPNAITAGVWYRVEQVMTLNGSTSGGAGKWSYYIGNSTTAQHSAPITGANFGTATTNMYHRLGRVSSDSWNDTLYMDDFAMDNSAEYIGAPPVASPTLVRLEAPSYRVNYSTSIPGGGGTLTYPTPTWVSGPVLSFTEPSDGVFYFTQHTTTPSVYTFTATESAPGGSASENVTIPPAAAGGEPDIIVAHWDTATNQWLED